MSTPIVYELEKHVLPLLHRMAEQLRSEFPMLPVQVHSYPIGTATHFQGHMLCISCYPHSKASEGKELVLLIGVQHHNTNPQLCQMEVIWGLGGNDDGIGVDLLISPEAWNINSILKIETARQTLCAHFVKAIRNPPSEYPP